MTLIKTASEIRKELEKIRKRRLPQFGIGVKIDEMNLMRLEAKSQGFLMALDDEEEFLEDFVESIKGIEENRKISLSLLDAEINDRIQEISEAREVLKNEKV